MDPQSDPQSSDPQPSGSPFNAEAFLKTATERPGVYRMFDADNTILYVGKARNLKKRLASYFSAAPKATKVYALVGQIDHIELTVTNTENEALILENRLIKTHQPRYNVMLRDDKGYAYLHLSTDQTFPRLTLHRGGKSKKGRYFGPYPSAQSVRYTLQQLQKLFRVRQCEDSFFKNRSRPCLQYQIKRCKAPCVGLISENEYQEDVMHTMRFLEGKSSLLIDDLVEKMEQASGELAFEQAASYRDQIAHLRTIQASQFVEGEQGDLDVVAAVVDKGQACVQVFFIRQGQNLGNKTFFPKLPSDTEIDELLGSFLSQFYQGKSIPKEVLVNHAVQDKIVLEAALSEAAGGAVKIRSEVRGNRSKWLSLAEKNARVALSTRLLDHQGIQQKFELLQQSLAFEDVLIRIECFDISHTQGQSTVASCVVFDRSGPVKTDYRRYNIAGITPGDDYAAMHQALERRLAKIQDDEAKRPDLLLIDGGKGQVRQAMDVAESLQIHGLQILGIAKGPDRKAGMESLILAPSMKEIMLPSDSPALHLLQQVRDEAHRFAIAGHRARRQKKQTTSALEDIPGLGPKRRQMLLKQFGGLQQIKSASVVDMMRVKGISAALAEEIYRRFHSEEG